MCKSVCGEISYMAEVYTLRVLFFFIFVLPLMCLWMCGVFKVLFERLRLHEQCENKKLPKTVNKQQSTSEAAVRYLKRVGISV